MASDALMGFFRFLSLERILLKGCLLVGFCRFEKVKRRIGLFKPALYLSFFSRRSLGKSNVPVMLSFAVQCVGLIQEGLCPVIIRGRRNIWSFHRARHFSSNGLLSPVNKVLKELAL